MSKRDKLLLSMKNNPKGDFAIADLRAVAAYYGLSCREPGGSHVTFSHPRVKTILTVPAHRPIKPFYIRAFVALIEEVTDAL